jgi:class 3 adenylate cyclase
MIGETRWVHLPDVSYARSGDVAIAYQLVGAGPTDIVFVRGMMGDLLSSWEQPLLVRHIEGLADFGRVVMLDKRGTGLSDRVRHVQSIETSMDDIRAVMDAADSRSAVLWTGSTSTGIASLFAATYPERCAGLVLFDPWVRGTRTGEYPWAPTADEWRQRLEGVRAGWGERGYLTDLARDWAAPVADDAAFVDWFVWHMRRSLSPGAALTAFRVAMELDVSDVLAAVRVPTLILPRPSLPGPGHYTAARIAGAELVELPGLEGIYTWVDDEAHVATMRATERFVARLRTPADAAERVLATILFTDIVGSTETAARLGDGAWRDLLGRHHAVVRRELARFHGRELDTAGDGFFAAFDGPARAVQAAAIQDQLQPLGIDVRAGLHTGECAVSDGKLAGIAVSIGARISALASPGEVLVSSTVKDLVAGSGLRFEGRGERTLKGISDTWRVYALVS